jgi:hypothetical protein
MKNKELDISGQKFNKLTALYFSHKNKHNQPCWLFKCDCGIEKILGKAKVTGGTTKSCGCLKNEEEISGKKFNKLTAISFAKNSKNNSYWLFICDCGKEKVIKKASVAAGLTKSCGCILRKTSSDHCKKKFTTHGLSSERTFIVWMGMKNRCGNKSNPNYHRYGGRGIKVCDRWLERFENFIEDMGIKPMNRSLDRIDNNKGYSKENCRWATIEQQAHNKNTTPILEYKGVRKTVHEWSKKVGIPSVVIMERINRYKWSVESALTTKIGDKKL